MLNYLPKPVDGHIIDNNLTTKLTNSSEKIV